MKKNNTSLQNHSANTQLKQVEAFILDALAEALKVSKDTLKSDIPFSDYGVDSILGVSFINRVKEGLAVSLNTAIIFDYATVTRLAQYIVENYAEEVARCFSAAKPEPQPDTKTKAVRNRQTDRTPAPVTSKRVRPAMRSALAPLRRRHRSQSEDIPTQVTAVPQPAAEPEIAVIGMSGQFPEAADTDQFWQNLIEGRDGVIEYPPHYLDLTRDFSPTRQAGKSYCKWGGILADRACFDPLFFAISPREAESMNPHQRLVLQESWKGLENAGYNPKDLADAQVGVFVGAEPTRYAANNFTGSSDALVASRLSYYLNLKGPAFVVNTGCSSSAVAIHLACESLRRQETDLALAGGVFAATDRVALISMAEIEMLSPRGRCHTLDASGDGTVLSEGIGMVTLKRLSDAVADNDHIYGVIKASGINQDGASNGITAPSGSAQEQLISSVYRRYQINPEDISYIEMHGTGTRLGDPIEANALTRAFRAFTGKQQYCGLGSAKSHIGHTSAASGVIGLIKILLSMQHNQLPGLLHFQTLNPLIELDDSAFYVASQSQDWLPEPGKPRMAALNSFGHSGTNAHLVIADYPQPDLLPAEANAHPVLIPVSAADSQRLEDYARRLLAYIDDHDNTLPELRNIAFTLQTGREAMRSRVVFVVENVTDWRAQLEHFIHHQHDGNGYLLGDVKAAGSGPESLLSEEDTRHLMHQWITNGELKKLAGFWINGGTVDWSLLYEGDRPQRVPLPGYPFAREHYWRDAVSVDQTSSPDLGPEVLHPLVHQNTSDQNRPRYTTTFTGKEFFLADHVIKGQIILPGVAHLELIRAAISDAAGGVQPGKFIQLRNVVWIQPIIVNTPKQISIVLNQTEPLTFEIGSEEQGSRIVHCQGRAIFADAVTPEPLNIPALTAGMRPNAIEIDDFYAAFRQVDIHHGPSYQGVTAVYQGNSQLLGKLQLPASVQESQHDYLLHPSLMESALQVASVLIAGLDAHVGSASLPFAIETLDIYAPCTPVMYVWVRHASEPRQSQKVVRLDIDLCDQQGNVCTRLRGFSFRRLSDNTDQGMLSSEPGINHQASGDLLIFKPQWHASMISPDSGTPDYQQHHIMLCDLPSQHAERLPNLLPHCHYLNVTTTAVDSAGRYHHYALSCFRLLKQLIAQKPTAKVLVQIVAMDDRLVAGLSAMLKTAALECPHIIGQILLTEHQTTADQLSTQLQAASSMPAGSILRYQQGQRYILDWQEIPLSRNTGGGLFQQRGVYLITGGLGGLGMIFAREILQQSPDARVILTGRSELTDDRQALLNALQNQPGQIEYMTVDVGDATQVEALITAIQSRYQHLNGIIHSAGIIADQSISGKTETAFNEVMAAKVAGVVHLDQATQHLRLDFMVLFSSISSVMGNPGQVAYAAANGFMDQFAGYRNDLAARQQRYGQTLALNWPLWEQGGMTLDDTTRTLMRQFSGALPLTTANGLLAFNQCLSEAHDQCLVMQGDADRIRKYVSRTAVHNDTGASSAALTPTVTEPVQLAQIQALLVEDLAAAIKLAPEKLELDVEFDKYGFDSIVLMDFVKNFNEKYGLELMPTTFFEYSTVATLSDYLIQAHNDVFARHLATSAHETNAQTIPAESSLPAISASLPSVLNVDSASLVDTVRVNTVKVNTVPSGSGRYPDIAIIGMDGRFPESEDVEAFWQTLRTGKNVITEIPADHWDYRPWYDEDREVADKTYCKWGSFVSGVDEFDAAFFNITPQEAAWMDPQMRLFLQSVYRCGEDAGLINDIRGSDTGVFVGVCSHDYMDRVTELDAPMNPHLGTGTAQTVVANRVSFLLNLTGPSLAVNTACSSSLFALHQACHAIHRQECGMAFVGGTNLLLSSHHYRYFSSIGALSVSGRCHSFDAAADGYVPGEAVASILLKPLAQARQDGDRIYGIVKGSAALHGGFTPSITAPSVAGEKNVIISAWRNAGIDPASLGYIEAHGTGTKLGDPIEVSALTQAFSEFSSQTAFCALGSAKANVGHTEGSAGIVGIIKVIQQMRHRTIPAMPGFEQLNPYIQLEKSALFINREAIPWEPIANQPRRAGVSSFGFSGAYAHVVLEEYVEDAFGPDHGNDDQGPELILLSAKTTDRLRQVVSNLLQYLAQNTAIALADIAHTLQLGREAMKERIAFSAVSKTDIMRVLQAYLDNPSALAGLHQGTVKRNLQSTATHLSATELARFIQQWQQPHAAAQLLNAWVKGQDINWQQLPRTVKPRRIGLPTYPFAPERHWLNDAVHTDASVVPAIAAPTEVTSVSANLRQQTLSKLTQMVAEAAGLTAANIDTEAGFDELGLDSIIISTLNKKLEQWTGKADSTLFFKYQTLDSLAGYLLTADGLTPTPLEPIALKPDIPRSSGQPKTSPVQQPYHPAEQNPEIAVIGMSGRYPEAADLDEFWDNLCQGKDCIREIPTARFDYRPLFNEQKGQADSLYCKWGGFIDGIDQFDPGFFKLSAQDARFMDPQERLFLETAWNCLESAGYITPHWQREARNIGVFAGVTFNNYQLLMAEAASKAALPISPLNSQTFSIANRVSYFFNFTGPSFTMDTACSSSLFAIHQACASLIRGECEVALAGGVNLSLHPSKYVTLCATGFAAGDGRCHAFAANGDGYVPSEGVGAVLLKPRQQAEADHDTILAIVKGSGVSHDGKTRGYTVPNPVAQSRAINTALQQAGISAAQISYVEAHGTGTALGDPIEIQGLMDVYSRDTAERQYCAIGSVKANIGHGESAAGIAQFCKTVLQLHHKTLVPSILHDVPNPNIDFEQTAFYLQQHKTSWPQPERDGQPYPRYAGISSFGAGGVNVHVIVAEAPERVGSNHHDLSGSPQVIPLSAHQPGQLRALVQNLSDRLRVATASDWQLADIAYTLQTRRALFSHRLAFVAGSVAELLNSLQGYLNQHLDQNVATSGQHHWFESATQGSSTFGLDMNTEEDREYLHKLLANGRADKLARLWVEGVEVPWANLYGDTHHYTCLPLPTYAFAKKRCWIDDDNAVESDGADAQLPPSDCLLDVQWHPSPETLPIASVRTKTTLVITEHPDRLPAQLWHWPGIKTALIGRSPDHHCEVVIDAETLDYGRLSEIIDFSQIDSVMYIPSAIDVAVSAHAELEQHAGRESHKLHRWISFCLEHLLTQRIKMVCLLHNPWQTPDPVQYALAKYFSFLRYEYPETRACILRAGHLDQRTLEQLFAEIDHDSEETEVMFRDHQRLLQRLLPLSQPTSETAFDASGCMVISGGFGGIGLKLLQALASAGTDEFVVMGRKPVTSLLRHPELNESLTIADYIRNMARRGVTLHYLQADFSQPDQVEQAFARLRPSLHHTVSGVFHLAGITTEAIPLGQMSESVLTEVMAAKCYGAMVLDRITANDPLRYFCLFSSVSAVEGLQVSGLSAYAAANASLQALAEWRLQQQRPVQLIRWSDWAGAGMAGEHDHQAFMDAIGVQMLKPEVALELLKTLLQQAIPSSIVFAVEWQRFSRLNDKIRTQPFFSEYVRHMDQLHAVEPIAPAGSHDADHTAGNGVNSVRYQGNGSVESLTRYLSDALKNIMDIEMTAADANLADLGLDSINAIPFFRTLSAQLTMDISPSISFRHPTIASLARYLSGQLAVRGKNDPIDQPEMQHSDVARQLRAALQHSEKLLDYTE
ncbi:SDR family NAD(P)-dependent oxidoreductase [Gynuella sunshinyii]|uniref:Polyketide synthase modules-related protein n=1 Tax=Gynuella sunshinyii YC6258 TaxID=1445510 RepID=A0A0C5V8G6_9GAMM|nr:SDR family NAD(P)-dependent oxidoreductase [Gynuella sunshinyii]AJQ95675.1 polyketide synthase modules-related protein [Gynuella sunshinyii YC6258]